MARQYWSPFNPTSLCGQESRNRAGLRGFGHFCERIAQVRRTTIATLVLAVMNTEMVRADHRRGRTVNRVTESDTRPLFQEELRPGK
ncbi:MAG: hypothetical protein ACTHLP_03270 [Rhizobiaceae bacterium]